jgi:hypothetical protein
VLFKPLQEARRSAVEQLTAARRFHNRGDDVAIDSVLPPMIASAGRQADDETGGDGGDDPFTPNIDDPPVLRLLCRTQEQVRRGFRVSVCRWKRRVRSLFHLALINLRCLPRLYMLSVFIFSRFQRLVEKYSYFNQKSGFFKHEFRRFFCRDTEHGLKICC